MEKNGEEWRRIQRFPSFTARSRTARNPSFDAARNRRVEE
jgi:hypothetical protein